jgi:hypothetical protein
MGERENRKDRGASSVYQLSNVNGYKEEAGGKAGGKTGGKIG